MSKTKKESFVFYETFYEQLKEFDDATKLKFYDAIIAYGLYGSQPEGFNVLEKALWKTFEFAIDSAKERRVQNIENGKKGGRPPAESKKYIVEYKATEVVPLEMMEEIIDLDGNIKKVPASSIPSPIEIIEKENQNKPKITENNPQKPNLNLNVNGNVNVNGNGNANVYVNENENLNDNEKNNIYIHGSPNKNHVSYDAKQQNFDSPQKKQENTYQKPNSVSPERLFKKPNIQEIKNYCSTRKNDIDPNVFYDFYESVGWFVGNRKMYDWRATVRIWEYRNKQKQKQFQVYNSPKEIIPTKPDYSTESVEEFFCGRTVEEQIAHVKEKGKQFECFFTKKDTSYAEGL